MENKRKIFWIILISIIIGIFFITFIILQNKKDARPFNTFEFPNTMVVTNGTNFDKADTIALVLAYKIFDIDTIDLKIYYIPDILNDGDMEFYGIVQKLMFGTHKYLILVNKNMGLSKLMETLSHEFIHIDQMERGDLQINGNLYVWKGEAGDMRKISYRDRLFEVEAFGDQGEIKKELNIILYGNN